MGQSPRRGSVDECLNLMFWKKKLVKRQYRHQKLGSAERGIQAQGPLNVPLELLPWRFHDDIWNSSIRRASALTNIETYKQKT